MTREDLLFKLTRAMARQEGWFSTQKPPNRGQRNNNPGNIWDGLAPGKLKRIWPDIPTDSIGFLKFLNEASGWALFEKQVNLNVNRGKTLRELITRWAPPVENDTETYIKNVVKWTGLPENEPLKSLIDA